MRSGNECEASKVAIEAFTSNFAKSIGYGSGDELEPRAISFVGQHSAGAVWQVLPDGSCHVP